MPSPDGTKLLFDSLQPLTSRNVFNPRKRFTLIDRFEKRPAIVTDHDPEAFGTQALIRAYTNASKTWQASGTNATSALVTARAGGGITLTTAGANNDQIIIDPMVQNSVQNSAFGWTNWLTQNQPIMSIGIITAASIASIRLLFALKLTNVLPTATDNDQAGFAFDTSVDSSYWNVITSNNNTDTVQQVDTTKPLTAPAASTRYDLTIAVGSDLRPSYYIGDQLVKVGPALLSGAIFRPVFGVQALTAAAKAVSVTDILLSRTH